MIYNKIIIGLSWGLSSALLGFILTNLLGANNYDFNLFIISMFTCGFIRGYTDKSIAFHLFRFFGISI